MGSIKIKTSKRNRFFSKVMFSKCEIKFNEEGVGMVDENHVALLLSKDPSLSVVETIPPTPPEKTPQELEEIRIKEARNLAFTELLTGLKEEELISLGSKVKAESSVKKMKPENIIKMIIGNINANGEEFKELIDIIDGE